MITRTFLLALALIESGNQDISGDAGAAQGPFQLHTVSVAEANRIVALKGLPALFIDDDRHDYHASMIMTKIILDYWSKHWAKKGYAMTHADLAAMHRFGPTAWKPSITSKKAIDRKRAKAIEKYMKK